MIGASSPANGENLLHLPTWLSVLFGVVFLVLGLVCLYFSRTFFKRYRQMKADFERKFSELPNRDKNAHSRDQYWVANTTIWARSKHLLLPLLSLVCFALGLMFVIGQQIGSEII